MATEKDPVCGMDVDTTDAAGQSDFNGKTYYFCSDSCKEQFDENPQQFAGDRGQGAPAAA
jgi:P-type Cu+ transporter